MRTVVLAAGRAKPLWMGHPWVFADSVARVEGEPQEGAPADWVRVVDAEGRAIGCGFHSPGSAIRVRLLTRGGTEAAPDAVLDARVRAAAALRARLLPDPRRTDVYRLLHAEGDGVPGLVVDRLGDHLVAQFATAAMHARREALAALLLEVTGARGLVARRAGFEDVERIAPDETPFAVGARVPEEVVVREEGVRLVARPLAGQKTGHYADQRENRRLVGEMAEGLDVLDLHCGTGGFALQALAHGARSVLGVDVSERSLAAANQAAQLAGCGERLETRMHDATRALADLRAAKRQFGIVVADPPNFFPRSGSPRPALKAYRELNARALSRVEPAGFLATFCCSAKLDTAGLLEVLRSASRDGRRPFRVLRELTAGPDHPVAHGLPEGRYLSGLLLQVGTQP